ncbi:hypothetical protein CBR_g53759 [Chara braunii]|uniref:Uncharacterized protein n=1 Tax=Chara braunii TaxID=69332 RepID=A0A388K6V8_CHABU|nr:hypothetical protein CBR_g53759 [Chara braunii]|eukprot:GBG65790.1 hypothetical protein CBR_g53759 [Chara braunii]
MDILEGIKMDKAIDEAKKKMASAGRSGVRIEELPTDNSRMDSRNTVRSDRSEDMKAWVTSTLGESPKLINQKLEAVDMKSQLSAAEKAELEKLREENNRRQKKSKESTSSEKRKRGGGEHTPMENSPSAVHAKSRSRGGGKTKARAKRIDVSSDEEEAGGVKHNLHAKLEGSSELSDIKKMLAALMQGIGDSKGKSKVVEPCSEEGGVEEVTNMGNVAPNTDVMEEEEESDEGGLAAYMKIQVDFYNSLHYTRVQELCRQKQIQYVRKDMGVWELARIDLQEYTNQINAEGSTAIAEPSRKNASRKEDRAKDYGSECGAIKGN